MRKVSIQTCYNALWGQSIRMVGSISELGNWDIKKTIELKSCDLSIWQTHFEISDSTTQIEFMFLVIENGEIIHKEYGNPHSVTLSDDDAEIKCMWQEKPKQAYFRTSVFKNSIFKHKEVVPKVFKNQIQLIVACQHVEQSQELVISGSMPNLGEWDAEKALPLQSMSSGKWHIALDGDTLQESEYKFALRDKNTKRITEWEDGQNRHFDYFSYANLLIQELYYRKEHIDWKASGVAIPIFSLRSNKSYGIGEFSDLPLLIDWAANAKLRVIQVLPINDTTATYLWLDSYPYNAISIYALHPIYLGLHEFQLKNKTANEKYKTLAKKLNKQVVVDYSKVIELKTEYIKDLFVEIGEATMRSKAYKQFYKQNENWLFPYACFCYLRDRYKTAQISDWAEFRIYDQNRLAASIKNDKVANDAIYRIYFTQYLLHKQLAYAKEYAYTKGVVLKGDIPIGISPNSVEAWTEPHLFNLDSQTGAPPDDFSVNGQNWGFPTYNWKEMQKDGYQWWTKRFAKMADYFDAYRIDHILGFFRIWEIPKTSVHGLLGYFSPALPLSLDEIQMWGFAFDEQMTIATVHKDDLAILFGEYADKVKHGFLAPIDESWYTLKSEYGNQKKIEKRYHQKNSSEDIIIRDGLYAICNEVLFVRDKYDGNKFHPRISIQHALRYKRLNGFSQNTIYRLYENYFYHRHTQFWRDEAMHKLPTLVNATNMLVCGEDLGMVPESVASVMNDLQILSLEIQRMPKQMGVRFGDLQQLPYLSVTTTSTHDMSPIRQWWKEDAERTQDYYMSKLNGKGLVPKDCNTAVSLQIIGDHLKSPAMLAILPLQDWLAISDKLKRENTEDEKINEPSDPHHNWNYRMHITLEELIEEKDFSELIRFLNEENKR